MSILPYSISEYKTAKMSEQQVKKIVPVRSVPAGQ